MKVAQGEGMGRICAHAQTISVQVNQTTLKCQHETSRRSPPICVQALLSSSLSFCITTVLSHPKSCQTSGIVSQRLSLTQNGLQKLHVRSGWVLFIHPSLSQMSSAMSICWNSNTVAVVSSSSVPRNHTYSPSILFLLHLTTIKPTRDFQSCQKRASWSRRLPSDHLYLRNCVQPEPWLTPCFSSKTLHQDVCLSLASTKPPTLLKAMSARILAASKA